MKYRVLVSMVTGITLMCCALSGYALDTGKKGRIIQWFFASYSVISGVRRLFMEFTGDLGSLTPT